MGRLRYLYTAAFVEKIYNTHTHRRIYIYILSNIVDPVELIKAKEDYKIIGH